MKNRILLFILLCIICVLTVSCLELLKETTKIHPTSDYYNFGDTRILKTSEYRAEAIYKESGELESWYIYFDNQYGRRIIECVDKNGYTATEWKDSFLLPFITDDKTGESAL
ncbi:MAG: hypothetical protein GY787_10610 [Alteromonadales bacterium]|nr:hypothetical protein [Alteromonadales bacterium]